MVIRDYNSVPKWPVAAAVVVLGRCECDCIYMFVYADCVNAFDGADAWNGWRSVQTTQMGAVSLEVASTLGPQLWWSGERISKSRSVEYVSHTSIAATIRDSSNKAQLNLRFLFYIYIQSIVYPHLLSCKHASLDTVSSGARARTQDVDYHYIDDARIAALATRRLSFAQNSAVLY